MKAYGNLTANDTIRFERMLPGPIERVWAHLVEPDKRRLWLADGPMTLIPGGEISLRFRNAELSRDDDRAPERYGAQENSGEVHGRILLCEPPHRLAFTWGDDPSRPGDAPSEVEIELIAAGERVEGQFFVLGATEVENDRLRERRTWLLDQSSSRSYLLLEFLFGTARGALLPCGAQFAVGANIRFFALRFVNIIQFFYKIIGVFAEFIRLQMHVENAQRAVA